MSCSRGNNYSNCVNDSEKKLYSESNRPSTIFQKSKHNEELRQKAERNRLAHEQNARRRDKEVARLREERKAFERLGGEHICLENGRLRSREKLSMLPYVVQLEVRVE